MQNLCPELRLSRRRVTSKFGETAAANLSLRRSMSPEAAVAADDVEPLVCDQARPFARERMPRMRGPLLRSYIGESHAVGRLLD